MYRSASETRAVNVLSHVCTYVGRYVLVTRGYKITSGQAVARVRSELSAQTGGPVARDRGPRLESKPRVSQRNAHLAITLLAGPETPSRSSKRELKERSREQLCIEVC